MTQFSSRNSRNHSWRATHEIFIWGQVALLAGVPWLWVMALRGLACGELWLPPLLELWVLLLPTVGLTMWLQWSKPLSPFSWWLAAVPWQDLTENQLRVFDFLSPKTNPSLATGWLGILVGITNVWVMSWALRFLPVLHTESVIDNHFVGVVIALFCLWLANFWLQASVSSLRVLLAAKSIGEGTSFYTPESVPQDFTHVGMDDILTKWLGVPKKCPSLPASRQPLMIVSSISQEAERLALEEQARLEAERLALEEQARLEAERLALEEQARLEAERLALEEQDRLLAEQLEREKQDRLLAEQLEREKQAKVEPEPPAPPEIPNHNELLNLDNDVSTSAFAGDPDPDDPGAVPSPQLIALIDQLLGTLKPDNQ